MPEVPSPPLRLILFRELRRLPFLPLNLHLTDGQTFSISHPDFCIVEDDGRTMSICDAQNRVHFIDLSFVVSIDREVRS
jgi:hypothetical protein